MTITCPFVHVGSVKNENVKLSLKIILVYTRISLTTTNIQTLQWIWVIFTRRAAGLAVEAKIFIAAFTSPALLSCVVLIAFVASKPRTRINDHIMEPVGALGSYKKNEYNKC